MKDNQTKENKYIIINIIIIDFSNLQNWILIRQDLKNDIFNV